MKLKKGSIEAKRYMAKIRAMKSGTKKKATKKKSLGATKYVEKNEPKNTKPKRTIKIERDTFGQFKKFKTLSGVHKDTKSHNVRISVMSGVNELNNALIQYENYKKAIEYNQKQLKRKDLNPVSVKLNKVMLSNNKKLLVISRKHIISLKKAI